MTNNGNKIITKYDSMKKKKKDWDSIPEEMQAVVNQELKLRDQRSLEHLHDTLELVKKKMENEFVKATPAKEPIKRTTTSKDGLINPIHKNDNDELLSK